MLTFFVFHDVILCNCILKIKEINRGFFWEAITLKKAGWTKKNIIAFHEAQRMLREGGYELKDVIRVLVESFDETVLSDKLTIKRPNIAERINAMAMIDGKVQNGGYGSLSDLLKELTESDFILNHWELPKEVRES